MIWNLFYDLELVWFLFWLANEKKTKPAQTVTHTALYFL